MFSLLWRFLPGPAWLRVVVLLALAVVLVWVVINYVYPWVLVQFPEEEATVGT